jgi:PiT family inorganic phosphate transporter
VLWAAFFNFIAFLFFGLHVANTVGKGIISVATWSPTQVIFGALMGAIVVEPDHLAARHPLEQSSHALIGGLVGAGVAHGRTVTAVVWSRPRPRPSRGHSAGLRRPSASAMALLLVLIVSWLFVKRDAGAGRPTMPSALLQFVSASFLYSLTHGGNDAQKTMGIIAVLLYAHGRSCRGELPACPSGWC